jgi:hypothetical protein
VRVAAHLLSREHACPRTLFFGVATGAGPPGETRGGKSWFQHGRPHSGRGGCLGGVARPDGGVKFVFFPWRACIHNRAEDLQLSGGIKDLIWIDLLLAR